MKRALILLAILAAATPVMAATQLEAGPARTHVTTKSHHATKHQKKHLKKKLAKRTTRKHKIAV